MQENLASSPFDRMVIDGIEKLIAQGGPAREPALSHSARLRTSNGRACLIGLMIPDDRYDPSMEKWPAHDVIAAAHPEIDLDERYDGALRLLMQAHDDHLLEGDGRRFLQLVLADAIRAAHACSLSDLESWICRRRQQLLEQADA